MTTADWYSGGQIKTINDLKIFYRLDGNGPALLCIHGFPSSSWDFAPIWPKLTNSFKVLAHDLVGLGKSSKPDQKLTVNLQADIIEELLLNEGIMECHILAHDLGDTIAQELLARQQGNTSKIKWVTCVFMNGGIFPETHKPLLIQKLLLSPFGSIIAQLTSKSAFQKNMDNIFSKAHPPTTEFIDETWHLMASNNGRAMIPKLINYMNERKTNRTRWVAPLEENIVPLRLINGIEDPISGKHAADRYKEVVPNADVILIENSGHYPHIETPNEVLEAFFSFHQISAS